MSQTGLLREDDKSVSSEVTMDLSPLLKLPIELRNIIYSYATIQPQWPKPQTASDGHIYRGPLTTLPQKKRAFLRKKKLDTDEPWLLSTHPLSFVNKQINAEISRFLRTSSMSVATMVRNFNFEHVLHFLFSLEPNHQNDFRLGQNGTSNRSLIIELCGPYTGACIGNLDSFISALHSFVGSEKNAGIATSYSTIPAPQPDMEWRRIPKWLVPKLEACHEDVARSGGKLELFRIMRTIYDRFKTEDYTLPVTELRMFFANYPLGR